MEASRSSTASILPWGATPGHLPCIDHGRTSIPFSRIWIIDVVEPQPNEGVPWIKADMGFDSCTVNSCVPFFNGILQRKIASVLALLSVLAVEEDPPCLTSMKLPQKLPSTFRSQRQPECSPPLQPKVSYQCMLKSPSWLSSEVIFSKWMVLSATWEDNVESPLFAFVFSLFAGHKKVLRRLCTAVLSHLCFTSM